MSSILGISSVSPAAANPYLTSAAQNGFSKTVQDFQSIGTSLLSGNVTSAQIALSTFQHDLPPAAQAAATQIFGQNSQASTDYQTLTNALKTGDLTTAQKAFAALQTDLKTAQNGQLSGLLGALSNSVPSSGTGSVFSTILSKLLPIGT